MYVALLILLATSASALPANVKEISPLVGGVRSTAKEDTWTRHEEYNEQNCLTEFTSLLTANSSTTYADPKTYRMTYNLTFTNKDAVVDWVKIWMPKPVQWGSQTSVSIEKMSPSPDSQFEDSQNGNGISYWRFASVKPASSVTVSMQLVFTVCRICCQVDESKIGVYDKNGAEYLLYTRSEKYVESDYLPIMTKAMQLVGNVTSIFLQARKIYDWVLEHMSYKLVYGWKGAKFAYDNGYGECGDYAALFVALCRVVGIPARLVSGLFWTRAGTYPAGNNRGIHAWAEFLLPGCGWIPVDPSVGDGSNRPGDYFSGHPDTDRFLVMSRGSNIMLETGVTASLLQIGAYWYRGETGKTELTYSYSVQTTTPPTSSTAQAGSENGSAFPISRSTTKLSCTQITSTSVSKRLSMGTGGLIPYPSAELTGVFAVIIALKTEE